MKFIAKFWRANPQLKNGGYETSRKIEAETISAAKKLAYEIEKKAAYGSMSLRSIEEAEAPVEATTQEATEEAAPTAKKLYSAMVKDGMRVVIIRDQDYPNKAAFIRDLRANGYRVNPKKVKPSDVFDYICDHTDMNPWDWDLKEVPAETTQEATEEAAPMKRFEVGKAYRTRDAYGDKSKLAYTITKRTAKTITFNDGYELQTCRVNEHESESRKAETVFPFGRSSLCPVLSADSEEAPEEPTTPQEEQAEEVKEAPKAVAEETSDSKLNPMCEKCANYPTDCAGTHEQVWTGCIHCETAHDENRTFSPKKLRTLTDEQLLTAWEFTEHLEDPQCPTIRGWLMDEIERRYPEGFNAWLDQDAPEDSQLRKYIMAGQ